MRTFVPESVSTHTRIRKTYVAMVNKEARKTKTSKAQVMDAALSQYFGRKPYQTVGKKTKVKRKK